MCICTGHPASLNMESHTHESEGARLNLTCWLLVGLSATFMSLRLYCKWLRRRKLWWDDYVLISAWVRVFLILHRVANHAGPNVFASASSRSCSLFQSLSRASMFL